MIQIKMKSYDSTDSIVAELQIFTHQGHDQIWTFAYGANMGSVRRVGISFRDNGGTGWWFFGGFFGPLCRS